MKEQLGLLLRKHEHQEDRHPGWVENRLYSINGVAYIIDNGVMYVIIPNIVEVMTKE